MDGSERAVKEVLKGLLDQAKIVHAELVGAGLAAPRARPSRPPATVGPMRQFDDLVTEPPLASVARTLYQDGHYARAVEEAFKFLNNAVKGRSGDALRDGASLMLNAFSETAPLLRLNAMRSVSERDEQKGYGFIFAGAMTGIRNPRAHEHLLRDEPQEALEMLVLANHLARILSQSVRTRRRRSTSQEQT